MPENSQLHTDNFNTIIHRAPGLGQDLDWLKSLHAEKILLVTRDHTTQRRLRLQTLTEARFVVLTEDEASAAQIQELQERVNTLEAEKTTEQQSREQVEMLLAQRSEDLSQLQGDHASITQQNAALQEQISLLEKELRTTTAQVELLRDCLVPQETPESESPNE